MATFRNPILPGFKPDPSICRVGDDFYIVTSSFEYFPGIPIHHSRDLVHWQLIGHVLTRPKQLDLHRVKSSGGLYAPTIRHHRGRFFVVCTHVGGGGNFLVTARSPAGPYSDPMWLDEVGIDPSLCFDRGHVYFTRTGPGTDFEHPFIYQCELHPKTFLPITPMRVIWKGTGGIWTEGPHLLRHEKDYWLLTAEGGTGYGHAQMVARAKSADGPFEPCPRNPILTHRHRPKHPISATGHMDWVTLKDGSIWAVFLGIRPQPGRHHHLGRESFLAPVQFDNEGWPRVGRNGQAELRGICPPLRSQPWPKSPTKEEFNHEQLGFEWVYLRNPPKDVVSLRERPGFLRLWGVAATLDGCDPVAFVGRRQAHVNVTIACSLEFLPANNGEEAGMTLRAREDVRLDLAIRGVGQDREVILRQVVGRRTRLLGRRKIDGVDVQLSVEATGSAYRFFFTDGKRKQLVGQCRTRALSTETMARRNILHFTGTMIGLYATGGGIKAVAPADFRWFMYRPRS